MECQVKLQFNYSEIFLIYYYCSDNKTRIITCYGPISSYPSNYDFPKLKFFLPMFVVYNFSPESLQKMYFFTSKSTVNRLKTRTAIYWYRSYVIFIHGSGWPHLAFSFFQRKVKSCFMSDVETFRLKFVNEFQKYMQIVWAKRVFVCMKFIYEFRNGS